jgi:sterol desaturase/sphingolipid hydroxylase (fatty acid hydroxylase superfamily)
MMKDQLLLSIFYFAYARLSVIALLVGAGLLGLLLARCCEILARHRCAEVQSGRETDSDGKHDGKTLSVFGTAAVVLGALGLPESYYHWGNGPDPLHLFLMFLLLDSAMYLIHYASHKRVGIRFLRRSHSVHHRIRVPNAVRAMTSSRWDALTLVVLPYYATLHCLPFVNLTTALLQTFAFGFLAACAHANVQFPWNNLLDGMGLVTSRYHHVHHLKPGHNLAHFFQLLDSIGGTRYSPDRCPGISAHPGKCQSQ